MKYLRAFLAGIKENLSFRGVLLLHIINPIIFILIISTIWASLVDNSYIDYFVVIMLAIPNFQYYSSISSEFNQSIRNGWDISFAKPTNTFLLRASYIAGKHFLPYLINLSIAIIYFSFFSTTRVDFIVSLISIPFITLMDISLAYFISLFSHFFYKVWGIRVLIRVADNVFGGNVFPLYLVRDLKIIEALPFANKSFFIADAILKGYLPVNSYINILIWSFALILVSYPFHRIGWKKLEGQGG